MEYKFNFIDSWVYFVLIGAVLLSFAKEVKNKSRFIAITFGAFVIFRKNVGWDYQNYRYLIENDRVPEHTEAISKFILDLGIYFNFYPLSFALFGGLTVYLVSKLFKSFSHDITLSWIIYLGMPLLFLASLSTIRQALALSFLTLLVSHRENLVRSIIIVFLAFLIHRSALIGIMIMFLLRIHMKDEMLILLYLSSFLISDILIALLTQIDVPIMSKIIFYYLSAQSKPELMGFFYNGLAMFMFFLRLVIRTDQFRRYSQISIFGVIIYNMFILEPVTAMRLSAYFMLYFAVALPMASRHTRFRLLRPLLTFGFIGLHIFYLGMYINNYEAGTIEKISFLPYETWLFD